MKYLKLIFISAFVLFLFYSCGIKEQDITTAESQTIIETDTESQSSLSNPQETTVSASTTTYPQAVVPNTTASNASPANTEITFDTDNKFIQAVIKKYNVESTGLVCIYDKNEFDNNYVFQFDGSKDENGKNIRTGDTLKYVYTVTGDCSKVCRTGGATGNDGLSFFEGMAIFSIAKQAFLPHLQDQINAG